MTGRIPNAKDALRLEEAAQWHVRDIEGRLDEAGHIELEAWLAADPSNSEALGRARQIWRDAGIASEAPEMLRMRARAVALLHSAKARQRVGRHVRPHALLALAACVALFVLASVLIWPGRSDTYRTGAGERRVVMLADGTRMTMDGATEVDVRFERDRRRLTLVSGRAKFDVAHDPLRPLSVLAGKRLTVATGTSFSVELLRREMRVILYQGRVEVMNAARDGALAPARPIAESSTSLSAGHELVAAVGGSSIRVKPADTVRSLTWESGMLTFVDEPLTTAVERMNRGSDRKLIIGDDATAGYRVSGDFVEGDIAAFVEGIGTIYPVRATRTDDGILLRSDRR